MARAMFFRCRGRRFRVTTMDTGVSGRAWVLDRSGRYSEHEGARILWHARTEFPDTVENLALLLEQAAQWNDTGWSNPYR